MNKVAYIKGFVKRAVEQYLDADDRLFELKAKQMSDKASLIRGTNTASGTATGTLVGGNVAGKSTITPATVPAKPVQPVGNVREKRVSRTDL